MVDYYDDRNKVESSLLTTYYRTEALVAGQNDNQHPRLITRIRTKSYQYVGMDRATAQECVAAKIAQYTRRLWNWAFKNGVWVMEKTTPNSYEKTVATVAPNRADGLMWSVTINVNEETPAYINTGTVTDFDAFFTGLYGSWEYDE